MFFVFVFVFLVVIAFTRVDTFAWFTKIIIRTTKTSKIDSLNSNIYIYIYTVSFSYSYSLTFLCLAKNN